MYLDQVIQQQAAYYGMTPAQYARFADRMAADQEIADETDEFDFPSTLNHQELNALIH